MRGTIEPRATQEGSSFSGHVDAIQQRQGEAIEALWPYALACVVASAYCWLWLPGHPIPATVKDLLSAVTTTAVSLFGFLLTAGAILVGIKGSWYKQRAKEAGLYLTLIKNIFTAMWWCLATAALTIGARCFDLEWKLPWYRYGLCVWIFCVFVALATTIRAIHIFSRLFILIAGE